MSWREKLAEALKKEAEMQRKIRWDAFKRNPLGSIFSYIFRPIALKWCEWNGWVLVDVNLWRQMQMDRQIGRIEQEWNGLGWKPKNGHKVKEG